MAITFDFELPSGANITYGKITGIRLLPDQNGVPVLRYTIACYVSEAKRAEGKSPLWTYDDIDVPLSDFTVNPLRHAYDTLVRHKDSRFRGAQRTSDEDSLAPDDYVLMLKPEAVYTPEGQE